MIDLNVCFYEISCSAFNRGIKNGCQQIASGLGPGNISVKMDQIYKYILLFFFFFFFKGTSLECLSLHIVEMQQCTEGEDERKGMKTG